MSSSPARSRLREAKLYDLFAVLVASHRHHNRVHPVADLEPFASALRENRANRRAFIKHDDSDCEWRIDSLGLM